MPRFFRLSRLPAFRTSQSLPTLRDIIATSDQGFLRLQLALRGTLSVFLATTLALVAARLGGFSPVECASGVTLSMIGPFLMREPTWQQRQLTLIMLLLPAIGATFLTALLHGHGIAGDSVFLLLVFLCVLVATTGPRAIGLGLVAVITTYVGLFLALPPATLPVQIGSQILAIPVVALACFVLVPMDATATLRRSIAAVQARAAQVIRHARKLEAAGDHEPRPIAGLRSALLRLNQAALAADDQLAFFEPGAANAVRSLLVDVEFWSARLIDHLETQPPHRRYAARLRLHARRIERGGRYATRPDQFETGTMLAALVALGNAVHSLGQAVRAQRTMPQAPSAAPPVRGPLSWRLATRVTLAAGLAMAGGMALSPQRWFWAVITVYVVFLNVRSRGDTIYKGIQRLSGTLLGIIGGLVIATMFSGDSNVEVVTLLLSIFGMYYFFIVSYTVGIFFVTVMLGLIYGMLGVPLETVLTLRLEETVIGAAAAIFVAMFVLPTQTQEQVRKSGRAVLNQLSVVARASAQALSGDAAKSPSDAMRQVDRLVADLKLALAPLVAGRAILRRSPVERPVSALLDCVHWMRLLTAEVAISAGSASEPDVAALESAALRLAELGQGNIPDPAISPISPADNAIGRVIGNLDSAITTLAERMELGVYETFAIEP